MWPSQPSHRQTDVLYLPRDFLRLDWEIRLRLNAETRPVSGRAGANQLGIARNVDSRPGPALTCPRNSHICARRYPRLLPITVAQALAPMVISICQLDRGGCGLGYLDHGAVAPIPAPSDSSGARFGARWMTCQSEQGCAASTRHKANGPFDDRMLLAYVKTPMPRNVRLSCALERKACLLSHHGLFKPRVQGGDGVRKSRSFASDPYASQETV